MDRLKLYPEMNAEIVKILRLSPDNTMNMYAAQLIEESLVELAAYRAIGTPEQCAAGVALMQKQEQGLVVELPCRVGDTVYRICGQKGRKYIGERQVHAITLCSHARIQLFTTTEDWLGKTVFLTRAEAEGAVK